MLFKRAGKKGWHGTVRTKMLLSLAAVFLLLSVSMAVLTYALANKLVEKVGLRLSEQNIAAVEEDLSDMFGAKAERSEQLTHLEALRKMAIQSDVRDLDDSPYTKYHRDIRNTVFELTMPYGTDRVDFNFIGIYMINGYVFESKMSSNAFSTYDQCLDYFGAWYPSILQEEYTSSQWLVTGEDNSKNDSLFYLRFVYEQGTMRKLGVIVFEIDEASIAQTYASYLPEAYLLDKYGMVMSSAGELNAGTMHPYAEILLQGAQENKTDFRISYIEKNGNEEVVFCTSLNNVDAYLIVPFGFYEDTRDALMAEYMRSMMMIGALVIFCACIFAIVISRGFSVSITSLANFAQKVGSGSVSMRYETKGDDEIAILGKQINQMLDAIQKMEALREESLKNNQLMELMLLQQQINPHLLYNTLDSVLWILQEGRTEEASKLVGALSEFFKISLSRGRDIVPLYNEIQLIKYYLDIQRLARRQNITLVCDVGEDLYEQPIIKLTLQPLVENAIIHGFAGYRTDGTIWISARQKDANILIDVTDNGIGMTDEEVEQINNVLTMAIKPDAFHHFGLFNVNRRIVQTYGAGYGLRVESQISASTTIRISLPYATTDNGEKEQQ